MKHKSIRFKLTLWFCLILITVTGAAFFTVLYIGHTVLQNTVRDYLISTVEENTDKIRYSADADANSGEISFPRGKGFLIIDVDFLQAVNEVRAALYEEDGTLIYGENPLLRQTGNLSFTQSRLWHIKVNGERYHLYDRKLNLTGEEEPLWIRGIVSEQESSAQLDRISRASLLWLPFLILFAGLIGYLLVDRMLSPLRRIEAAAEEISEGTDLKRRIEPGKNRDEVWRLSSAFNRMLDRLERAFERERRFTSDASHELRTPTAVLLAQSEYVLEKERTPAEYTEAFEVVQKQSRRMDALITDMLDCTRIDQGELRYAFSAADLSEITRETAEPMRRLRDKSITLETEIEDGIVLHGNAALLTRLLQNLLDNAYRYGKEKGTVRVTLKREKEAAVLSVSDDGAGIPAKDLPNIFDRFYRGDASRSAPGTGLGLSMVKSIADLHGAEIRVESEPGKGSTFRIIFSKK